MKKLVSILMALVMILAIPMTSLAAEPVTIEFLFGDPNRTELFGRIVDDFNASHDDIQVSYTPSGLNHLEQLRTRLATNEVPDMTSQLQGMELKSYVEAGHIMNIKDEPFMDYILPSETATVTVNDGVYGIPMDTQAWGVFYNKDLFAKAGITEVPKTVSELEEVVEKLKAAGITPFAAGFATEWTIGQFLGYGCSSIITPAVQALGENYKKGNFDFNLPGMDRALDVLDLIVQNTQDRAKDTDVSGQYAVFAKEEAAMMPQGNWSILQIRELNEDLNMGMFPLPVSDNPEDVRFPVQYGFVINVLAKSEKIEAIRTFVDYFMDPEGEVSYYFDEIGIPTANGKANPKLDGASDILQEYMQEGKTVFTYYSYEPAGFDVESWKVTLEYINEATYDHAKLIERFNETFDKFADSL